VDRIGEGPPALLLPALSSISTREEMRPLATRLSCRPSRTPSERLHHHQDHDQDQQERRHLVEHPVECIALMVMSEAYTQGWMHAKLALVLAMSGIHGWLSPSP
jgi:hypothetical protein